MKNLIEQTHPQWHSLLHEALACMDKAYLTQLKTYSNWLPVIDKLLAAFGQPLDQFKFILLGESPYPRAQSANGYAFWDAAVNALWSNQGLSKEVNRATSLRNIIKMLLLAQGDLSDDLSQPAIAKLDKTTYWQTGAEFFSAMVNKGFLLLNASLVYEAGQVQFHAKQWRPFMASLFTQLAKAAPELKMILFGKIAAQVPEANFFSCLVAEHPYNVTFINNPDVLAFFKPLNLLMRDE